MTTTTTPKTFCFVLMPFDSAFDDVYQLGIKAACNDAGAYCERVDEQIFQERILDRIYNQIAKADLVVADMTGRNPNVFYEVGYAHALGRPTILLTRNADDIPFDLKHFPHIVYEAKLTVLKDALTKRVAWHVENPRTSNRPPRNLLDVYVSQKLVTSSGGTFTYAKNQVPYFTFTIHNSSVYTFGSGMARVGVIVSKKLGRTRHRGVETTALPDGRILHMLKDLPELFPEQYKELKIVFETGDTEIPDGDVEPVVLRLFTNQGSYDYPISLIRGSHEEVG